MRIYRHTSGVFEYGAKGKPSLTAKLRQQTGLEFNLSHSGDWLLIGVAQFHGVESGLFGVDIEGHGRRRISIQSLNHYFSPQKLSALLALADEAVSGSVFRFMGAKGVLY